MRRVIRELLRILIYSSHNIIIIIIIIITHIIIKLKERVPIIIFFYFTRPTSFSSVVNINIKEKERGYHLYTLSCFLLQ